MGWWTAGLALSALLAWAAWDVGRPGRATGPALMTMRAVGDTLALSPPLIVSEAQIDEIFDKLGKIIKAVA